MSLGLLAAILMVALGGLIIISVWWGDRQAQRRALETWIRDPDPLDAHTYRYRAGLIRKERL